MKFRKPRLFCFFFGQCKKEKIKERSEESDALKEKDSLPTGFPAEGMAGRLVPRNDSPHTPLPEPVYRRQINDSRHQAPGTRHPFNHFLIKNNPPISIFFIDLPQSLSKKTTQ